MIDPNAIIFFFSYQKYKTWFFLIDQQITRFLLDMKST